MNMNKKINIIFFTIVALFIFNINAIAMNESTIWDSSTEELVYSYEASVSGIRRIWLECSGTEDVTITLYNQEKGFTDQLVSGRKDTNNVKNGSYYCKAYVATNKDNKDRATGGDVSFTKNNYDPSLDINSSEYKKYCDSITIEEDCLRDGTCIWDENKNSCRATNIASRPCDEPDIKRVLNIFGYILLIVKVAIPLIIIGFATFDLFKSVIDKDEKSLGKQVKMVMIRVLVGIFVFFIPNLVNAVFTLSDKLNVIEGEQYQACATCILNPNACDIDE